MQFGLFSETICKFLKRTRIFFIKTIIHLTNQILIFPVYLRFEYTVSFLYGIHRYLTKI